MIEQNWVQLKFQGKSMHPVFSGIDCVWADFSKPLRAQIGDVVIYRDEFSEWVCHRLVMMDQSHWYVMGDQSSSYERISPERVWGVAKAVSNSQRLRCLKKHRMIELLCWCLRHQALTRSRLKRRLLRYFSKALLWIHFLVSILFFSHKKS